MDNYPAVAVHLVVHNGESWLRDILGPLMKQTWPNLRILLLDSASDDDTPRIVQREYPRVRYIYSDKNVGIWRGNQDVLMGALSNKAFVLCKRSPLPVPYRQRSIVQTDNPTEPWSVLASSTPSDSGSAKRTMSLMRDMAKKTGVSTTISEKFSA
jgi:hypothetical protein